MNWSEKRPAYNNTFMFYFILRFFFLLPTFPSLFQYKNAFLL